MIKGRLAPEEGAVVEKALKAIERQLEEEGFSAETLEEELAVDALEELGEQAFNTPELDQRDSRAVQEQEDARQRFFDSQMTSDYSRRRADALVALAEGALADVCERKSNSDRYQVMVHIDGTTLVNDDLLGRSELDGGPSLPPETIRRLGCDCDMVAALERDGEILNVGRKTRSIPTSIRRALEARDRWCRFPGCTNKVRLDAHHIQHWGRGGETKLSNLALLCRAHHRAVHEYGYEMRRDGADFRFFRPDGTAIEVPEPPASNPEVVVTMNRDAGLDIDAETSVPDWYGDKWDCDVTVSDLMRDHDIGMS